MDLFGDLGGVMEILMVVFGVFTYPIGEFSFILNASHKLFKAKSQNKKLFKQKSKQKKKSAHQKISLGFKDRVLLYLYNTFGRCACCFKCWQGRE